MHINYQFNNNNYKSTNNHEQFKVFSEGSIILPYSLIIYNQLHLDLFMVEYLIIIG